MITPDFKTFEGLAARYPVVPVYREMLADQETPVSAFRKLEDLGHAALLESIEGDENWGRYSMIALDPGLVFESRGGEVLLSRGDAVERRAESHPLQVLDALVGEHRSAGLPGLPRLAGGAVGFASYDLIRRFERLPEPGPDSPRDDLGLPDTRFVFFGTVVLFDHQHHTIKIVVNTHPGGDPERAYGLAKERIDGIVERLARKHPPERPVNDVATSAIRSSTSRTDFERSVLRAKEYIRAGDVVQVVLSHRLELGVTADPFDVYRALRVINPSPYMFFLRFDELVVLGSSPEVLVRREGQRVETRPIAGTRPRGSDESEDRRMEEELRGSEKERAEHVMLVDLGRNDIGRVSRFGSVETTEFMEVERYSHVMHLVSSVRGEVEDDVPNADVLQACFPAGTVSGAPKIRAMEIIDELEPVRRGIYAGAVGYLDFHGNMDTCIAIRTMLIRDGKAFVGVGAGIVADSDPAAEYEETLNKGSALLRACELAERGLASYSRGTSAKRQGEVPASGEEGMGR